MLTKLNKKIMCISEKLKCFSEEVTALKEGPFFYKIGFGFLLFILFPFFVIEIIVVLLLGKDLKIIVPQKPVSPTVLIDDEVPNSLRDLAPLARKYGIGDDADRGDIMLAASLEELSELEEKVLPRQQEISDWLDTFPENEITDTAAFFLYLGSACDEVPVYIENKRSK